MTKTIEELKEEIERLELMKKKAILEQEIHCINTQMYIPTARPKPKSTPVPTLQNHSPLCRGCIFCSFKKRNVTT